MKVEIRITDKDGNELIALATAVTENWVEDIQPVLQMIQAGQKSAWEGNETSWTLDHLKEFADGVASGKYVLNWISKICDWTDTTALIQMEVRK